MSHPRPILLVHSDPGELRLLREQLLDAGLPNPIVALLGADEAIDYLEAVGISASKGTRFRPCLLLVDDTVPTTDARRLIDWARQQPTISDLKIMILSDEVPGNYPVQFREPGHGLICSSRPEQIAVLARTECAPGPLSE